MAGLRDPKRFEKAARKCERALNACFSRHIRYLGLLSAFLGLGVGS